MAERIETKNGATVPSNRGIRPDLKQPIELSDNARTVLSKRYLRKGDDGQPAESIAEMFWRVAWHVAAPEEEHGEDRQAVAEKYFHLLTQKRFFPNSPTFTGAGTPLGQLAACFVLPLEDDMGREAGGIFQTLRNAALIQQTGGGNGFAFSRLRPKGARVKSSNGEATGPIGFLRVYDQAFGEIAQGGKRRGANMAVLRVDHPDIKDFITCKTNENAITNFNISVGITDAFMEAVKADDPFDLVNPQDGTVWETVQARELFDAIIEQSYHNGEPGLLFLDAANRDNPVPHLYEIEATNPCFTGDTRIPTEFGLLTIKELAESGIAAFITADDRAPAIEGGLPSGEPGVALRQATPAVMTKKDTPVMRLITKRGYSVIATPDHRFLTTLGYMELKDLRPGDNLMIQGGEGTWSRDYRLPDMADLHVARRQTGPLRRGGTGLLVDPTKRNPHIPKVWSHEFGGTLAQNVIKKQQEHVPDALWAAPREAVIGFIQGLTTTTGEVLTDDLRRKCSLRLTSKWSSLLKDVQLLLANFGIISQVGAGVGLFVLTIEDANLDRFAEVIGFTDKEKQDALIAAMGKRRRVRPTSFTDTVLSIEDAGKADVYDLTQEQTHSLIANGLVAHNCGEQFLGPSENCCLGSVNLSKHLTDEGRVDWQSLAETVALATRFLDDVVDANAYVPAVPELRVAAQRVRRIGLGIMGLGDLMYAQGVRYGSEAGIEFASQVMEFVHHHSMRTSVELAKERGPFPAITGSYYDPDDLTWSPPQPLISYTHDWGRPELDWPAVENGIKKKGIRNGAQTTIAPTGTISTVAGVEGYGCEPVFALAYTRYFDDNGTRRELQYTSPLFEAALIEAGIEDEARERIIEQVNQSGTCQNVEGLPESLRDAFVVAGDIKSEQHVRTQAAMQRFVSNAISKTCNFPSTATAEDVAAVYQLAWELGCKGLTVYVAGSRDKVVLETADTAKSREKGTNGNSKPESKLEDSLKNEPKTATQAELPLFKGETKRPRSRVLKGTTRRIETPLGTTFVTINENGGDKPFEVFLHTSKAGSETAAVSEAMGRLISYILRMNSPVDQHQRLKEIVVQLEGIGGGRSLGLGPNRVRSLPDGVAQSLAEYLSDVESAEVVDGEAVVDYAPGPGQMSLPVGVSGDLCPECGEASLVNEEGCRKCYSCGFSEC